MIHSFLVYNQYLKHTDRGKAAMNYSGPVSPYLTHNEQRPSWISEQASTLIKSTQLMQCNFCDGWFDEGREEVLKRQWCGNFLKRSTCVRCVIPREEETTKTTQETKRNAGWPLLKKIDERRKREGVSLVSSDLLSWLWRQQIISHQLSSSDIFLKSMAVLSRLFRFMIQPPIHYLDKLSFSSYKVIGLYRNGFT